MTRVYRVFEVSIQDKKRSKQYCEQYFAISVIHIQVWQRDGEGGIELSYYRIVALCIVTGNDSAKCIAAQS